MPVGLLTHMQKGCKEKVLLEAAKKYRGHRILPESILQDFDDAVKAGKA